MRFREGKITFDRAGIGDLSKSPCLKDISSDMVWLIINWVIIKDGCSFIMREQKFRI